MILPTERERRARMAPQSARDLRLGGRWSATQRAKNALIYHVLRAALRAADGLPPAALLELGRFAGHTAFLLCGRLRERARTRALGCPSTGDPEGLSRACFVNAGENLALCLLLRRSGMPAARFVEVDSNAQRTLCEAVDEGRGVVFVSAHLGPFELVAARVAELGFTPSVVVRESYDPRLDPLVDAHRTRRGIQVIHRGAPGAAARVLRALRRCQPVGFLVDLPSRVRSVRMPFLGAQAAIPVGPQRLCQLTGARLLVGTLCRRLEQQTPEPRFSLKLTPVFGSSEQDLTWHVTQQIERDVLTRPEDWLWMS